MSRSQLIRLEPQVLQLSFGEGSQAAQQKLRVINLTDNTMPGLFFCLYNQEKIEISPQHISLQPKEEKTIMVKVKLLQKDRKSSHKEYAYLKSAVISKRLTILVNMEDTGNLLESSRISEKYEPRDDQTPTRLRQSQPISSQSLKQQNEQSLNHRFRLLQAENEQLRREIGFARKQQVPPAESPYKSLYERQKAMYNQLKEEMDRLSTDKTVIDLRRKEAESQLQGKQGKIRSLEYENAVLKKKIEDILQNDQKLQQKIQKGESELLARQEQLRHIRSQLENLTQAVQNLQSERVAKIKTDVQNSRLKEVNEVLQQQIQKLQATSRIQKQQIFRLEAAKEDKSEEYLRMALEASKNQNSTLKASKFELQKALTAKGFAENELQTKITTLQEKLAILDKEKNQYEEQLIRFRSSDTIRTNAQVQTLKQELQTVRQKLLASEHRSLALEEQSRQLTQQKQTILSKLKQAEHRQQDVKQQISKQLGAVKSAAQMARLSNSKLKKSKVQQEGETAEKTRDILSPSPNKIPSRDNEKTQVRNTGAQVEVGRVRSQSSEHRLSRANEQLSEAFKVFQTEKLKVCRELKLSDDTQLNSPSLRVLGFFRQLQFRLAQLSQSRPQSQYLQQIKQLKLKLAEQSILRPTFSKEQHEQSNARSKQLLQFIQEQMKTQFSQLQIALDFSNDKFEILKKRAFGQYRRKITGALAAKTQNRIQNLLQRILDGLTNLSHKQAAVNRQTRKHRQAQQHNKALRHRIHELDWLIVHKEGLCSRSPLQVIYNAPQPITQVSTSALQLQAQLLSSRAEVHRVTQELSVTHQKLASVGSELTQVIEELRAKEEETLALKEQVLKVQRMHKEELSEALEELELLKMQTAQNIRLQEQLEEAAERDKSAAELREQLGRKKELIRALKEREKGLVQIIEDIRQHVQTANKPKKSKQEQRMQQLVTDFRERNKELQLQLERYAENQKKLSEEISRKNSQLSAAKANAAIQERQKSEQAKQQIQSLEAECKKLEQQRRDLKRSNGRLQHSITTLQNKVSELEKQLSLVQQTTTSCSTEFLVREKGLLSTIRSLVEILRRVWRLIEIKVRKYGANTGNNRFEGLVADNLSVDVLRLYDQFETLLAQLPEPRPVI